MGDRDIDRLIDSALARYTDAEPLDGIEQRVLNRVLATRASRRRAWWFGIAASAVATALLLIAVGTHTRPAPPKQVARVTAPPARQPVVVAAAAPARPIRHRRRPTRRLPKERQFPSPAPLTGGEQALLAFVRRNPAQAVAVFVDPPERV